MLFSYCWYQILPPSKYNVSRKTVAMNEDQHKWPSEEGEAFSHFRQKHERVRTTKPLPVAHGDIDLRLKSAALSYYTVHHKGQHCQSRHQEWTHFETARLATVFITEWLK